MDKFKIDSHKLIYHVQRVSDWNRGKNIYPVYIEISPSGSCNHRCTFCAYDFVGYKPRFLDSGILEKRLQEMGSLGVKSILYSGEGEPCLHPQIAKIIKKTKESGIDAALATNGVLLKKEIVDEALDSLTWVKVSINAGTKKTYCLIHRAAQDDFDRVMENLSYAVKVRKKKKSKVTLGMQILLLPENYHEVGVLARQAKKIGMDYLVVKPYSQHPLSKTTRYKDIKYNDYIAKLCSLEKFNGRNFHVVLRLDTMKKWDTAMQGYRHCLALDFWAHIDASGNVWGCPIYFGNRKFLYGNILKDSIRKIWEGRKKRQTVDFAANKLNVSKCRINCRMDQINRYLWELKNPPMHVNFI